MIRMHVIREGQTEEMFVNEVMGDLSTRYLPVPLAGRQTRPQRRQCSIPTGIGRY